MSSRKCYRMIIEAEYDKEVGLWTVYSKEGAIYTLPNEEFKENFEEMSLLSSLSPRTLRDAVIQAVLATVLFIAFASSLGAILRALM